ncbi:MAG: hypothetical protein JSS02_08390 [Planctomycetes bacterium]|nr:hypothetical protein [Planctomycetota bacterium]
MRAEEEDAIPDPPPQRPSLREPTALDDDANLHDVQFVGIKRGWAVGDQGVIWHSEDGGDSWVLQNSGVQCPLRSVCFLSDKVGWVAGGGTIPFTGRSYGVILATNDGGLTWKPLVGRPPILSAPGERRQHLGVQTAEKQITAGKVQLPRLRKIRFFSLEEGVAIGEGAGTEPSGVYITEDGGKTWRSLPGKAAPGWLGAEFLNLDAGILVGVRDSLGVALERHVTMPRFERLGTRNRNAIALDRGRSGWLVGDGGMVLRTENDGVVWQQPERPLPAGIRETFDFQTVCCRDQHVWVAGNPGSMVWHSPDAGKSWQKQRTGITVPLEKLFFASPQHGWCVGALGTMARTIDGGRTWQVQHGEGRRAALLSLYGRLDQVSLGFIAEMSAELGYRSVVSVVSREESTEASLNDAEAADRFHEAVTRAGGSQGKLGWQLRLSIPGLDKDFDRLVQEWNRRTENHLDEVLTGQIVRQIRTWKPSVLILDQPESAGPLEKLVAEAAQKAVAQAADPTVFLEHQDLAGLEPWTVQKTYLRLPTGTTGQINLEPYRYLPHVGETAQVVAATAEGLFLGDTALRTRKESLKLWTESSDKRKTSPRESATPSATKSANGAGGMFAGIALTAGGPARRALASIDDSQLEGRLKSIQKLRNFASYSDKMLNDDRQAGQLIAQLPGLSRGLSDADAAWQLLHLAERYEENGYWELAELALSELTEKFPDEPASVRAIQRLMQAWGSSEMTWRRVRKTSTESRKQQTRPDLTVAAAVEYADQELKKQSQKIQRTVFTSDDDEPEPILENEVATPGKENRPIAERRIVHRDLERKQRYWRTRAMRQYAELMRRDPALAADPSVQFPLASLLRQRTSHLKADAIFQRFANTDSGTPWAQAARGELWLTDVSNPPTSPVTRCNFTTQRPALDGVLSDACWENGFPLPLKPTATAAADGKAEAFLCYDSEYLYFAAKLPRVPGFRTDGAFAGVRKHDEDLSEFDRIVVSLDVDRDYATSFNLTVDQRGCTNDSCWHDTNWNPKWFVAVMGDDSEWRVEAAIPLDELVPYVPGKGVVWAVGVTRITPAIGLASWSHPATAEPHPETFGLLRFDPPGEMR